MSRYSDTDIQAIYRVIEERRDMRHFRPNPIDPALLERLLQAAHRAPSVGLMQPWRFIRITDAGLRTRIYKMVEAERVRTADALGERGDEFMRLKVEGIRECGEVLVAALMDDRERYVFGRRTLPEMDLASVACAIQNFWLASRAEGIGVGWVSVFDPLELKQMLSMPRGAKPVAILCVGHVDAFYPKPMLEMERWASRQRLTDLVFENRWQADAQPSLATITQRAAHVPQENPHAQIAAPSSFEAGSVRFTIPAVSTTLAGALQHKIDQKTKPCGALGRLEKVALRIGLIQNTLTPDLCHPTLMVFAADHGAAREGVSPYPQQVTMQMVMNFLNGGAAINVFARQHALRLRIVDAGVNHQFAPHPDLIDAKIAYGTRNFLAEPAMTAEQCTAAINQGALLVRREALAGCNVMMCGEMGIGNTASAALIMSRLCGVPVADCVGRGTGLDDVGLARKRQLLERAAVHHPDICTPLDVLAVFGGFEIAMMVGALLQAAQSGMVLLIDGFIVGVALLVASRLHPSILDYCIFAHQSDEAGHRLLLHHLNAEPLMKLGLRLGECSGAALAYPLLASAINFLNEMSGFDSGPNNTPSGA
jgi:nicotinate-nucleotide--dimethylbenzimidazole phosphoribosyltransferase